MTESMFQTLYLWTMVAGYGGALYAFFRGTRTVELTAMLPISCARSSAPCGARSRRRKHHIHDAAGKTRRFQ
jgi:hypothetical protein